MGRKRVIVLWFIILMTLLLVTRHVPAWAQVSASDQAARQQLEQELKQIEQQISQYEQEIKTIKGEKNTLQNKINQLKIKQSSVKLQIDATNIKLNKLSLQVKETQAAIDQNEIRSESLKGQMADYLRLINTYDDQPFYYSVLIGNSVTEAINDYRAYLQVIDGLGNVLETAKRVHGELDQQVAALVGQQDENKNLLSLKLLQQEELVSSTKEQATLLQQTKGRESDYQKALKNSQARVQEIKSRIYQLLGVSSQITFGQAVDIAKWVSGQTGVRVPFLLAVLTQESNLGKNVGTCNRLGDPPEKGWRVIMKPGRDQEPFLAITKELGMNPDITPVSCPMKNKDGSQLGWGGAMGPAQFIPSTWMGYRDRVVKLTGKSPANPWDVRDAFVAAAILLKGNGADGTRQGEWNAAMRYFSGSTNPAYSFYGDSVMELTDKYQSDVTALE